MKLLIAGDSTKQQRMQMLNVLRSKTLDEIHLRERQLERMDYLRNEIRNRMTRRQSHQSSSLTVCINS